jgi:sugar phosphate isomerase/epimerase
MSPTTPSIRIGNQTAISCAAPLEPFVFALRKGFTAFEWFADKKRDHDGRTHGWDESDMSATARFAIRRAGRAHDMRFTVHAPWQANPLQPQGALALARSIDFARDIGAGLVNLHLYLDAGVEGYVTALLPVLGYAAQADVSLSIENTPATAPKHFNQLFAALHARNATANGAVGMCLDLGHANLCRATPNDYLRFLDDLSPEVPVIHLHVHENYGDADSHLTLFTGPSRSSDAGIRGFLERLHRRAYQGVMILEQWPAPPDLLTQAAVRLQALLNREWHATCSV